MDGTRAKVVSPDKPSIRFSAYWICTPEIKSNANWAYGILIQESLDRLLKKSFIEHPVKAREKCTRYYTIVEANTLLVLPIKESAKNWY